MAVRSGQGYTLRFSTVPAVRRQLLARCQPLASGQGIPTVPAQRKAEAITGYLGHRRSRWPNSTSPHLLISRNTATTTTAVGTFWLDKLVRPLPVGLDRLRQDRILEEALPSGADPLHLAHVFSIGAKTSLRYTTAVATSVAEDDPRTP
ncbi:hypothetical protein [Streptomyces sp. NPDC096033]|uniref:hypothetical protein n=1 Tax=Streptomyces sp. NPDC096033 TaxID=3366071 RepID=UPI00381D9AD2